MWKMVIFSENHIEYSTRTAIANSEWNSRKRTNHTLLIFIEQFRVWKYLLGNGKKTHTHSVD